LRKCNASGGSVCHAPQSKASRCARDWRCSISWNRRSSEIDAELLRLSTSPPWAAQVPVLIHVPGIGLVSAMTVLAASGDLTRFPTAKRAGRL
jgi:transposase